MNSSRALLSLALAAVALTTPLAGHAESPTSPPAPPAPATEPRAPAAEKRPDERSADESRALERSADEPPADASPKEEAPEIVIGGVHVGPLEKREIYLRASQSYSATEVEIPLVVVRGAERGPTLCLVAGIHGDELNGIEIVRRVLESVQPGEIRGTLIGAPIVNLFGFWNHSRYLPDRRDLNRHFPGSAEGSTASRIAHRFWQEVVRHCTHLIDFHTGSLHRSNLAQVRGDLSDQEVAALALAFGERVVVHNPGLKNTLRAQAVRAGIPAILYEAGETMRFQKEHITKGVQGVRRVMHHLGMIRGPVPKAPRSQVFFETHWIRATQGGIVELVPSLGDRVAEGAVIGIVTDPLRNAKGVVTSPYRGIVIGKVLSPTVLPGLALLHLGIPNGTMEESEGAEEEIEEERPE